MNEKAARLHARLLMSCLAGRYKCHPLGVQPSRGAYGSPEDWDVFTSMCDARTALVLALGRRPHPCTGHVLPEVEQLSPFGGAA